MVMRRTAFILVTALLAGLFASAAQAEIKTQWIDYREGDTPLRGYLAYDDSIAGKRPGVLLVHRYDGMSELTLQNAEMYARQGYAVFAADIYGRDIHLKSVPEFQAQSALYNKDRPLMRARAQAGFEALLGNPIA